MPMHGAPHQLRMGRRRPSRVYTGRRLAEFIRVDHMPAIPATFSYWTNGKTALTDIYGNDRLGDCGFGAGPEALKRPTVARCESRKPSRQSAAVRPGKRRATSPQKAFPYGPWASKSGSSRPSTTPLP